MNEGFVDLNVSYLGELWVLLEFSSVKSKEAFRDNVGVSSWFSEIRQASFDINPDGRIVWVEIEGVPLKLWTLNTFKRIVTRSFSRGKVYWIRAKEVPGWTPDLVEDSDEEELICAIHLIKEMKNLESENIWHHIGQFYPITRPISSRSRHDYGPFPPDSFTIGFNLEALMIFVTSTWNSTLLLTQGMRNMRDRFAKPSERRANIDMRFPKTISEDQSQDLEREVSKQEIKTAVWDCGIINPRP
ncbi:hypothetical protein Tco_0206393 [Tanacetum coccineum]